MYRSLNAGLIVQTCRESSALVSARFPGSGLSKVAAELLAVSEHAAETSVFHTMVTDSAGSSLCC